MGWRLSIRRLKSWLTKIATRKQATTISFIETVRVFGDPTPSGARDCRRLSCYKAAGRIYKANEFQFVLPSKC